MTGLETLPSFFDREVVNLGKGRPRVTYTMNEFWAQKAADEAKKAATAAAEKAKTLSALSTNFREDHKAVEHILTPEAEVDMEIASNVGSSIVGNVAMGEMLPRRTNPSSLELWWRPPVFWYHPQSLS